MLSIAAWVAVLLSCAAGPVMANSHDITTQEIGWVMTAFGYLSIIAFVIGWVFF